MKNDCFPSIEKTAFECPHCAAFSAQTWFTLGANPDKKPPAVRLSEIQEKIKEDARSRNLRDDIINNLLKYCRETKIVLLETSQREDNYPVRNLFISKCFSCENIAIWTRQSLLFPSQKTGPLPNQDLPEDIIHDFNESRSIVDLSPRGAAALLRLCIQKICKELGEKGNNINDNIANLVNKGLNPIIQKSLDIVRVIGNDSVHGGVMDIKDDKDTALNLFNLVNLIAEQMISGPKNANQTYERLPEGTRRGIEKRDKTAGN